MKVIIVIPARMHSTRLPQKPLIDLLGTSMIMRVYHQAMKVKNAHDVIVATDHDDIYNHVNAQGGHVIMTSNHHATGTDRVAEVAKTTEGDFFINIQGDEPLINPLQIEDLIGDMNRYDANIATQCTKITDQVTLFNENTVKVVRDNSNKALYFSRQAIPAVRNLSYGKWFQSATYYRHIGIYGFKKNALLAVASLPLGKLEECEKLEQLRWMENGHMIHCFETQYSTIGIDTQEDISLVVDQILKNEFS
ncbi:MAG: 3-deoxy-manno-octulosonate cytidylyltransferase [Lewinellaceae bacterium]|nr:3-deoxy-manno-octulosonate cytidylyltransferase [Lewinellaceae bacterium]